MVDLAQVNRGEIIVWINRSGLAFSGPIRIPIPSAPLTGTIRVADMNGCGRSGLVWNSVRGREIVFTVLCGDPQALPLALTREHLFVCAEAEDVEAIAAPGYSCRRGRPFEERVFSGAQMIRRTVTDWATSGPTPGGWET